MIDRTLNYGRHLIEKYVAESGRKVKQILDLVHILDNFA